MLTVAREPRWWPWHLALVVALVAFGWLGWWQVASFDQAAPARPAASAEPGAAAPGVPLDRLSRPGGRLGADDLGRTVLATGTWDAAAQLLVPGRERAGRTGWWVVTPLRTSAGVFPVVRGWVPERAAAPPPLTGTVAVTAVLQRSETEADAAVPVGSLDDREIAYVATVTLLAALPYDAAELYDGYGVLRAQQPVDPRAPALVTPEEQAGSGGVGRWRNLAYGLQWWLFALAAVWFWAAVLRRAAREPDEPLVSDPGPRGPLAAPPRRT